MTVIDTDDLAMLAAGFEAAMQSSGDDAAVTAALFELGWGELLEAAPRQGTTIAFAALGVTGSAVGILDDVVAAALGLTPSATTAVVLPAPASSAPPGRRSADRLLLDGMASRRIEHAERALLAVGSDAGTELVSVDAAVLRGDVPTALDPDQAYRRIRAELDPGAITPVHAPGTWTTAVAAGRVALALQLISAARTMLDQARAHAVERVQFGRPVASFQAIRHRLAEALVHIEAAAGVVDAVDDDVDDLLAALAKSLAGQAARATAAHAQQVLAGIGFTTDHPFHRWMKRALVLDVILGSSTSIPTEVGAELLRRSGAPRLVELGTHPSTKMPAPTGDATESES